MGKIHLLVELEIQPDKVQSFIDMFHQQFAARSLQEHGCELYQLWQSRDNAQQMTIVESWSSQQDLDNHLQQHWFAQWSPKMEQMLAKPMTVRFLQPGE